MDTYKNSFLNLSCSFVLIHLRSYALNTTKNRRLVK